MEYETSGIGFTEMSYHSIRMEDESTVYTGLYAIVSNEKSVTYGFVV
jgi:hypothetical protein